MIEAGTKGHIEAIVTSEMTARAIGSGELEVLATPKLAALIEDGAAEQTHEEPESASDSDVLAEDLFTAQDPNGLQSTYRAIELPFGTVITIEGVEFLHTLIDHGDHGHSAWVNTMAELLDDNTVAELARSANGNVTIIHFG